MGRRDYIKAIQDEIAALKKEIQKRENIIEQVQELEDIMGTGTKKRGPGRPVGSTKKKRGPGRPAGTKKKKRGPGRPPGSKKKRGPGRPPKGTRPKVVRKKYDTPVGDMIAGVLKGMKQPVTVDALAEKVHKKYPTLGGVKYRAIVSSIVSRDSQFKRSKDKVSLK